MVIKMVEILLMAGLSAVVEIEYFKTFFRIKKIKAVGCFICFFCFLWKIIEDGIMMEFPIWSRMMLSILFLMISSYFFIGDCLGKIVFSILHVAIAMLTEALVACFFILLNIPIESNILLGTIGSKILLLIIVKVLQCFFCNRAIRELSWNTNLIFMLLPVGSMFLVHHIFMVEYQLNESNFKPVTIMCMIIVFVINVVVFHLYLRLSEYLELKYKNSMYEKELSFMDIYMKEKEDTMIELRRKRHDLKHQMTEWLSLLQNRQYEKLENCIKEQADLKFLEGMKIAHTENSIVDAFINYKYEVARKNNIEFRVKLDIPTKLPFENGDIGIILGNALDNAIEANIRSNIQKTYVDLKVKYEGENLLIVVENSFDGKIVQSGRGESVTRKSNKEEHGLGIGSIQNVLKKYHGYYEVKIQDNVYCLKILLHGNSNDCEDMEVDVL